LRKVHTSDEFHTDARETPPGTAAQDTARYAQRVSTGPADGVGQPHLSNFLHNRRQLSLEAIDRVLAAQHLTAADLLPVLHQAGFYPVGGEESTVPVVSHHAALFEPYIRPSAAQSMLHLPAGLLG